MEIGVGKDQSIATATDTTDRKRPARGGQTLKRLKERRDAGDNSLYYTAIINEYTFVTDNVIISVWKDPESYEEAPELIDTYYWDEIDTLSIANLPAFHSGAYRQFAEHYHYKINVLFRLLNAESDFADTCDCRPRHVWWMNDMLNGKAFKEAAEAIISNLILNFKRGYPGDLVVIDKSKL
jgi:hypothetical protein